MQRFAAFAGLLATISFTAADLAVAQAPNPMTPVSDDTPEEIADDAARDMSPFQYYNRSGATRAQYEADWQACRLIARGSRTPAGAVPIYVPAGVSIAAAAAGGLVGGLIGSVMAQGKLRRENRRTCMLVRGWSWVQTERKLADRLAAMPRAQRTAFLETALGAPHPRGKVTRLTSFGMPSDPALNVAGPATGPATLVLGDATAAAVPFTLAPNEAAVVLAYRRPDAGSMGRSGHLQLSRYNVAAQDLVHQPSDWNKTKDLTTYRLSVASRDKRAPLEIHVVRITPGDYVLDTGSVGVGVPSVTNCFGAPTFRVGAGEVVYLGDFIPFMNVKLADGDKASGLGFVQRADEVTAALNAEQPALAAALRPAALRNGATYGCSAVVMTRWDLQDAPAFQPERPVAPVQTASEEAN